MRVAIVACLALLPSPLFAQTSGGEAWYYCASQTSDSKTLYYSRAFSYRKNELDSVQVGWTDYLSAHSKGSASEFRGGCSSRDKALEQAAVVTAFDSYISALKGNSDVKEVRTDWQYH